MDDKLLNRVRGLLAKAESSDFPSEQQALRAKAESLIVLHGIEQAMLTPAEQDPVSEMVIKFEGSFTKRRSGRTSARAAWAPEGRCPQVVDEPSWVG